MEGCSARLDGLEEVTIFTFFGIMNSPVILLVFWITPLEKGENFLTFFFLFI